MVEVNFQQNAEVALQALKENCFDLIEVLEGLQEGLEGLLPLALVHEHLTAGLCHQAQHRVQGTITCPTVTAPQSSSNSS